VSLSVTEAVHIERKVDECQPLPERLHRLTMTERAAAASATSPGGPAPNDAGPTCPAAV